MTTTLQRTMPVYHFRERHSRVISASPDVVWQALTTLTFDDLSITRPLVALRYLGRRRTSGAKPVLSEGPTTIFDLDAPHYAIGGSVSRPWRRTPDRRTVTSIDEFAAFDEPGWVKYLVDFDLTPEGDATRLSTETRGYSTNDHARRMFRFYWAAIRLGSGVIRRDVLASVARASAGATGRVDRRRIPAAVHGPPARSRSSATPQRRGLQSADSGFESPGVQREGPGQNT